MDVPCERIVVPTGSITYRNDIHVAIQDEGGVFGIALAPLGDDIGALDRKAVIAEGGMARYLFPVRDP
jgi:hypothetical protein